MRWRCVPNTKRRNPWQEKRCRIRLRICGKGKRSKHCRFGGLHPVKRPAEIAWNVMAFIGRSWALRILPESFSREEGVLARRKPPSRGLSGKTFCTDLLKPSDLWLRRFGMWSCAVVSCYFSGLFCASNASEVSVHSAYRESSKDWACACSWARRRASSGILYTWGLPICTSNC